MASNGFDDLFENDEDDNDSDSNRISVLFDDGDERDALLSPTEKDDDFSQRRLNQSITSGSNEDGKENVPQELIDLPMQPSNQESRIGPVSWLGSKLSVVVTLFVAVAIIASLVVFFAYQALKPKEIAETPLKNDQVTSSQEVLGGNNQNGTGDGENNQTAAPGNVVVPKGGKYIRYEVKGDSSLSGASVTWFDAKGSSRSNLGVDLPWTQPVGRDKGVQSAVAVSTKGSGTITCTIFGKDNKILSQKSSSGSNPTVQCSSR